MTDNEIIKASECCTNNEDCINCPLLDDFPNCNLIDEAQDLLKRQQAEAERLQKYNTKYARKHYQDGRAEAIKEFAEELIEGRLGVVVVKDRTDEYARGYFDAIEFVDNKVKELVAEMVGKENE